MECFRITGTCKCPAIFYVRYANIAFSSCFRHAKQEQESANHQGLTVRIHLFVLELE